MLLFYRLYAMSSYLGTLIFSGARFPSKMTMAGSIWPSALAARTTVITSQHQSAKEGGGRSVSTFNHERAPMSCFW